MTEIKTTFIDLRLPPGMAANSTLDGSIRFQFALKDVSILREWFLSQNDQLLKLEETIKKYMMPPVAPKCVHPQSERHTGPAGMICLLCHEVLWEENPETSDTQPPKPILGE